MVEIPVRGLAAIAVLIGAFGAGSARAAAPDAAATPPAGQDAAGQELLSTSLEDLLSQQVTSVAKKAQRVGDSAGAVYVITQDQIAHSPARTLVELLKQVPGLEVFDADGSSTAVAARGLSSRFTSNLLVMVDGAAIYSSSISGMFWDEALIPLQDVERIEVIRGPGGTLWGSNSISGIINIITKQSIDTQGLRADARFGPRDVRAEFGFGTQLRPNLGMRVYGTYRHSKGMQDSAGHDQNAPWDGGIGGLRVDYAPDDADTVVGIAEYSQGAFIQQLKQFVLTPSGVDLGYVDLQGSFSSVHVLSRWRHTFSPDFELTTQAYYNHLSRTELGAKIGRDLYDASIEGRWRPSATHEFNFGISGRISHDTMVGNDTLRLSGDVSTDRILTGYVQDEISIIPDRLKFTLGSKLEANNFNGFSIQPSARIFYRANQGLAFWASVSQAVHTPLLQRRQMILSFQQVFPVTGVSTGPVPVQFTLVGNPDEKAEKLLSFEAGVRGDLGGGWKFDIAVYRNSYRSLTTQDLISAGPLILPPVPYPLGVALKTISATHANGHSLGGEVVIDGQILPALKVEFSYAYLDLRVDVDPGFADVSIPAVSAGTSSRHQFHLSSTWDPRAWLSLSANFNYFSESYDGSRPAITDLGARVSYRPATNLEISLVGNNLLNGRRLEFSPDFGPSPASYVPRAGYLEARFRF